MRSPLRANCAMTPGPGSPAMSGGVPPSTRAEGRRRCHGCSPPRRWRRSPPPRVRPSPGSSRAPLRPRQRGPDGLAREVPVAVAARAAVASSVAAATGRQHQHRDDERGYHSKLTHPVPPPAPWCAADAARSIGFCVEGASGLPRAARASVVARVWRISPPVPSPIRDRRRGASPWVRRTSRCRRRRPSCPTAAGRRSRGPRPGRG